MRAWVCAGGWGGAALAAAMLAGCEQPEWRTRRDAMPAMPAWAQPLMGRPLQEAFTLAPAQACVGNTETVETRYGGAQPGAKVTGWGWDAQGKAPTARVVVTGPDRRIAGAGEAGLDRMDVSQALPAVTSSKTGWWALTTRAQGPVDAWGVLADGARVCPLGRVTL